MSSVKYDNKFVCNKCGGQNKIKVKDTIGNITTECETTCSTCGFEDYWSTGWFSSSSELKD